MARSLKWTQESWLHILTQLSLKHGLSEQKEQEEEAVTKELTQLYFQNTFDSIDSFILGKQEMRWVIELHLFLKLKCNAIIKERMVAGGNKQCSYIPKEEATAPMVSLESVMLISVIDV